MLIKSRNFTFVGFAFALALLVMGAVLGMEKAVAHNSNEAPQISNPWRASNGDVSLYWALDNHDKSHGESSDPDGWRLEVRHRASGRWSSRLTDLTHRLKELLSLGHEQRIDRTLQRLPAEFLWSDDSHRPVRHAGRGSQP